MSLLRHRQVTQSRVVLCGASTYATEFQSGAIHAQFYIRTKEEAGWLVTVATEPSSCQLLIALVMNTTHTGVS